MADTPFGPGTVLAGRFTLDDLLDEHGGARFWRATDQTLARSVAVDVVEADDARAETLLAAARTSATVTDGHILRVLDAPMGTAVPITLTSWDFGFLRGLYDAQANLRSAAQRSAIGDSMNGDLHARDHK